MSVEPQGYTIHALRRSAMYLPVCRMNKGGLVGCTLPTSLLQTPVHRMG